MFVSNHHQFATDRWCKGTPRHGINARNLADGLDTALQIANFHNRGANTQIVHHHRCNPHLRPGTAVRPVFRRAGFVADQTHATDRATARKTGDNPGMHGANILIGDPVLHDRLQHLQGGRILTVVSHTGNIPSGQITEQTRRERQDNCGFPLHLYLRPLFN